MRADLADFRRATPSVRTFAEFQAWNDRVRVPLVDSERLGNGLAKIGWS